MRKENVFVVFGRSKDAAGDSGGAVVTHVVCGVDEESTRRLATETFPGFVILSVTSLMALERTVQKVKNVLAGTDTSWSVLVEPGL